MTLTNGQNHVPSYQAYAPYYGAGKIKQMSMKAAPYGEIDAFVVKSPTGVWIEFFQQQ